MGEPDKSGERVRGKEGEKKERKTPALLAQGDKRDRGEREEKILLSKQSNTKRMKDKNEENRKKEHN